MYKVKVLGIGVVATLLLTSFVMAETHTSGNEKISNPATFSMQPPAIEWNRTYGGTGMDVIRYVQQTDDGGYIAVGMWNEESHWLLKVDKDGNEEWNLTVLPDNTRYPRANFVQQTSDGGYIVTGSHEDSSGTRRYGYNRFLWKVDATGTTEWLKTYGEPAFGYHTCVQETSDGGFIVCGEEDTIQIEGMSWDVYLMKTDSQGNKEWQKTYNYGEWGDNVYAVRQTPDGGYILSGRVELDEHEWNGDAQLLILKTDANGEKEWDKLYGGPGFEACMQKDILITNDGGYVFFGRTTSFGGGRGYQDCWLVKTDSQGNMEWNETYGGNRADIDGGMDLASNGGYIFTGVLDIGRMTRPFDTGTVVKTDTSGNAQWSKTFAGDGSDQIQGVCTTSDGGYILSGNTNSFTTDKDFEGWLIKLAPDHDMETPEMTVRKPQGGRIYLFDLIGLPFPFTENAIVIGDLTFQAQCSDPSGIEKVEFFIDDKVVDTVEEEPFTCDWTEAERGVYTVKIRAYNMYGGTCKEEVTIQKIF